MKLASALIAKSIAETVLVAVIGIVFYLTAFPPYFHGWGEAVNGNILGWAVDQSQPWRRVDVQLFIDGKFVAATAANQSRPDVIRQGWSSDEWHGYVFPVPTLAAGLHEARVYAVHASDNSKRQTLQLLGDPIRLLADDGGRVSSRCLFSFINI
jgi:hypothetical protein